MFKIRSTTYFLLLTSCYLLLFFGANIFAEEEPPLKIEAFVIPSENVYPGERIKLVYRISFKGDIELSKEELPFVNPYPLQKTSSLEVNESTAGNYNIQEIIQEVRASEPGKIDFGSAILEGKIKGYVLGEKDFESIPVKAEALPVQIVIKSFPEKDMPVSFSGALGQFSMDVKLTSNPNVNIGDILTLQIKISGKGEWDTVKLPNLMCQPGFSGFFKLSDLPPQEKKEENSKTFTIDLHLISLHAASLPIVEFSFFNPDTQKYETLRSEKIPITVRIPSEDIASFMTENEKLYDDNKTNWNEVLSKVDKEMSPLHPMSNTQSILNFLGSKNVLLLIPFFLALLFLQKNLKDNWEKYKKEHAPKLSRHYMQEAKNTKNVDQCISLVEQGLTLALKEKSLVPEKIESYEELPSEGILGEVKNFLRHLSQIKFGKSEALPCNQIVDQAQAIYENI